MATSTNPAGSSTRGGDVARSRPAQRLSTETKHSTKTTEFFAMIAVIVGILVSAAVIKGGDTGEGTDEFIARQAWLYVSIVAGAYFISRGLAKSGSREPYWADGTNADRGDDHR